MSTQNADDVLLRDGAIWDAVVESGGDYDEAVLRIVRYLAEAGFAIVRLNDGREA